MSRRPLVALAIVALLTVPSLPLLAAPLASAQATAAPTDPVPGAQGINWVKQVSMEQTIFANYPDLSTPNAGQVQGGVSGTPTNQPDCAAGTTGGTTSGRPTLAAAPKPNEVTNPRTPCVYTANVGGAAPTDQTQVTFNSKPLSRGFNVTTNDSLVVHFQGSIPSDLIATVSVLQDGTVVNSANVNTGTGQPPTTSFNASIKLPPGADPQHPRYEFLVGHTIGIQITVSSNNPASLLTGAPQWTVSDAGTALYVHSSDSMRAATWTQDKDNNVRSLFPPFVDKTTTPPSGIPLIIGYFAVQSAFGLDDASSLDTLPQFTLTKGDQPVPGGPNGDGRVPAVRNDAASSTIDGIAEWRFQDGQFNYQGFEPGEYNLTVLMKYHNGGAILYGTVAHILISAQSVALTPYDDSDPTTSPSPLETTAHTTGSGQSTTYLLLVHNTGAANDTFRVDATPVSANGWSVSVGGPEVVNGVVQVNAGDAKVVTVTIGSPPGSSLGSSSIFQVVATSLLDPTAKSQPTILTSTVTNDIVRDVGIILPNVNVDVLPGKETRTQVYVWNRGTRTENLTIDLKDVASPGWTIQLFQGSQALTHVVLPNVPSGSITKLDLAATGPQDQPTVTHDVTLNATDTDVGGVAVDKIVHFTLRSVTGVHLQVLDLVGGVNHTILVTGSTQGPVPASCEGGGAPEVCGIDDGVKGALWRVWVTNTGRRGDTFDLTLDNQQVVDPKKTTCIEQIFTGTHFGYVNRNPDGSFGDANQGASMVLAPNQTGEIYVWKEVNNGASPMDATDPTCPDNTFQFVITAKGRETGALDRFQATAIAKMTGGPSYGSQKKGTLESAVLVEAAQRAPGFSPTAPIVDLSNTGKYQVVNGVQVNTTYTFYVRVTDASNYGKGAGGCSCDPAVSVTLDGVNRDGGWNVSIRNASGTLDPLLNPYTDHVQFSNDVGNHGPLAFNDREIEVRVTAPDGKNGTGFAGDSDEFTITAAIGRDIRSTLNLKTVIVQFANVSLEADSSSIYAHPGENGAFLLFVNNTGSSPAVVTLTSNVDPTTQNAGQWVLDPATTQFTLAAFKNTTIALNAKPPAGATSGSAGTLNVTISYPPNPFLATKTVNQSLDLGVQVVQRGALELTPQGSLDSTIGPGGFANFTMQLRNRGSQPIDFALSGTLLGNWTQTISPASGTLSPNEVKSVVYVVKAPEDVVNDSRFSSIVRVVQPDNTQIFDLQTVNINILGGKAFAALSPLRTLRTVDRNGQQGFEVNVKNTGTAAGKIDLTVRTSDPTWSAVVTDPTTNAVITSVTLGPNELKTVNVTVKAPFFVPEHQVVNFDLLATANSVTVTAPLQAAIHDYGVHIEMSPARLDAIAGLPTEWTVQIRNDGNDNDTLNISADMSDAFGWPQPTFAQTELRLEPGQSGQIRVIVKSPTDPQLPTPRAYNVKFYVGTRGGQAVNLSKNESVVAVVNILNYRSADVDRDNLVELAVDSNKDPSDGFEKFVEIFPDGVQSAVVATGKINGRATFFLDQPSEGRSNDGIADTWFNPDDVYVYPIRFAADVNSDNSPDYLLDTDRDGKIDKAFDAVSGQFWSVIEIHAFGPNDPRIQYLVDTTGDGRPDRYYDPSAQVGKQVTRTINVGDRNLVGIDTNNDGKVTKVYDIRANSVSDAKVYSFLDFAKQYWYFFVLFVALVILTIVLVARRRRGPE